MRIAYALLLVLMACAEHGSGGGSQDGGAPGDAGSGSSSDSGGGGAICGGLIPRECPPDEWCDFGRDSCGISDEAGTCRKRPLVCDAIALPVCACDNMVHGNACEANAAGFDVNANGACPVPPGKFACGFRQCATVSEYCEHTGNDIGNQPDGFACKPLPGCPSNLPNCACLTGEPCGAICTGDGVNGLTLTCLGG